MFNKCIKLFSIVFFCFCFICCEKNFRKIDNYTTIGIYWKNGIPTALNDTNSNTIVLNTIFVNNNDIYLAGFTYNNKIQLGIFGAEAFFWKNGDMVKLKTAAAEIKSLVFKNNTLYMCGLSGFLNLFSPSYWLNTTNYNLKDSFYGAANSIFVNETDVFIAGDGNGIAKLWKNGDVTNLSNTNSKAQSIFVVDSNIYIGGAENEKPTYWKNKKRYTLSENYGEVTSIFVVDTNVFAVGKENDRATYWKNGISETLSQNKSSAASIFVNGTDVHISGTENMNGFDVAKYWKNGVGFNLTDGKRNASAKAIFVKGNDVYVAGNEIYKIAPLVVLDFPFL